MLRIAGVPGAGKSAVAWELSRRLTDSGSANSYVDIDQLGMCYPAPEDDPKRWALKEKGLAVVAARFAATGCTELVVSGVADPAKAPPLSRHPTASLWLDVAEQTQRTRLVPREWPQEQVDAVVELSRAEAARLHHAWKRHATDRETVAETADAVLQQWTRGAKDASGPSPAPQSVPGRVLWLTGPRGVGVSRIAWEIVSDHWQSGVCAGFVDVRQLSFAFAAADRGRIGAENAAELRGLYADAGARLFVAAAPFEIPPEQVAAAFPGAKLTFVRITADADTLTRRIHERTQGGGPQLAGDDLANATPEQAEAVLARALRQMAVPPRSGESLLDTTDLPPAESAARLLAL